MAFDHDARDTQDSEWTDTWAISRCEHGCVHLQLDRTCITLTPTEFERLAMMLTQAARRFATEARPETSRRSH
jgi:DNA-binding response OmpR family regulator